MGKRCKSSQFESIDIVIPNDRLTFLKIKKGLEKMLRRIDLCGQRGTRNYLAVEFMRQHLDIPFESLNLDDEYADVAQQGLFEAMQKLAWYQDPDQRKLIA